VSGQSHIVRLVRRSNGERRILFIGYPRRQVVRKQSPVVSALGVILVGPMVVMLLAGISLWKLYVVGKEAFLDLVAKIADMVIYAFSGSNGS